MNSNQAKKVDFPDLLARLGHHPIKASKGGRELWYQSPFRKEKDASFHTSFLGGKWIWNDFGDAGGNVIDFVMQYQSVPFKEALAFLRNVYQGSLFDQARRAGHSFQKTSSIPFQQQSDPSNFAPEGKRELEFLEAYEIRNPVIISYLEEQRKIPIDLARLYLMEVKYRNILKNKVFFAFGMENESGGWEIRSASDQYKFKSALIERDITVIRGRGQNRNSVSVFEGMVDFLSLLVLQKRDQLEEDSIVMHSVSSFNQTLQRIEEQRYEQVFTFLDNDPAGAKNTVKFEMIFGRALKPQTQKFAPNIDLNNFLIENWEILRSNLHRSVKLNEYLLNYR